MMSSFRTALICLSLNPAGKLMPAANACHHLFFCRNFRSPTLSFEVGPVANRQPSSNPLDPDRWNSGIDTQRSIGVDARRKPVPSHCNFVARTGDVSCSISQRAMNEWQAWSIALQLVTLNRVPLLGPTEMRLRAGNTMISSGLRSCRAAGRRTKLEVLPA